MARVNKGKQDVSIEEQVGMFLHILGQGSSIRAIGEYFQRSVETIHRTFNNVLRSVPAMHTEFIKLPDANEPIHPSCIEGTRFHLFMNALGAIGGKHIPAIVRSHKQDRYRNRKGFVSQNVLVACNFDMKFVFVSVGWEGSAADMKVLRSAIEVGGFIVPAGRYYLADSGYANTSKFLCPYRGRRYHLAQFQRTERSARYPNAKDLFNHCHAQLRNVIERTFGVLKKRFKVLVCMPPYKFKKQCLIVLACCVIHNFIKCQTEILNDNDIFLNMSEELPDSKNVDQIDGDLIEEETHVGEVLRNTITNALWSDYHERLDHRN